MMMTLERFRHWPLAVLVLATSLVGGGCWSGAEPDLTIYCALDQEFSEPILKSAQADTGLQLQPLYDVESTKTVGLVNRILNERRRPVCDVFWNNEILHTLRLQREGLLVPCQPQAAESLPSDYRSPKGLWYGFAARARVLIVNTEKLSPDERPTSVLDLADPKWKGKCGIAKPLFGTTATHAAVLFQRWGEQRATEFFEKVADNAQVMSGNKQVALAVARGQLLFGLTDTDDAIVEKDQGMPVDWIFPDQQEDQMGTLFIPNTLCVVRGADTEKAERLLDFLLSPSVERRLARGASAQFPIQPSVSVRSRAQPDEDVQWMDVDFEAAASHWDQSATILRELFATAVD